MVTVQDVAAKAQVSIATVSRVINQTAKVKEETRRKVLQAVEELGFVPNPLAQGLVTQTSRSIGLIIPQVTTPAYAHIVSGVEHMVRSHGFTLYVCTTNFSTKMEEESIRQLIQHCVGGVIVASGLDNEGTRRILRDTNKPAVFINREWHSREFDSFYNDGLTCGRESYQYLISMGHRDIGLLVGDYDTDGNRQKLEGIYLAAGEQSQVINPELVIRCKDSMKGGVEGMSRLLQKGRATAIIAFSDALAVGGIRATKNVGFEVPRHISFLSFNNSDLARCYDPALTSMDVKPLDLGKMACQRLITRITAKKNLPSVKKKVAVSMVVRDSCTSPLVN